MLPLILLAFNAAQHMQHIRQEAVMKYLIKRYLKSLTKHERSIRLVFVGRRLKIKQYNFLHFTTHPWELSDKE